VILAVGNTRGPVSWLAAVLSRGGKAVRGVKLATDPHLVPKLRMNGPYLYYPICCACNVHWPCHFSNRSMATRSVYCHSLPLYVWIKQYLTLRL